jgi:hypothetical protein
MKNAAQRFHTSKFCGSIFDILRFSFPGVLQFAAEKLTPETRNLKPYIGFEGSRMNDSEFESTFNL